MSWFIEWWNSISLACQIYALIAIAATLVLVIQLILLIFGLADDADISDFDSDHDIGLKLFSVRGVIAFFALFGWCGVACIENGWNSIVVFLLAFAAGMIGLVGVALTFFGFSKLQEDGTKDISTAIGKTGSVYIPIPANRSGKGKVNMVISGSLGEFDAYTDEPYKLPTGQEVEVVGITDDKVLIVRPNGRKENV